MKILYISLVELDVYNAPRTHTIFENPYHRFFVLRK